MLPFAEVNTTVLPGFRNLFNGDIAAMGVNIDKLARPLLYRYSYDQLNRLDSMQAYDGLNVTSNIWAPVATADYRENISYDGNGNILSYLRNGTTAGGNPLAMDNMAYHYKPATNQLDHVSDDVASTNYNSDIDDQSSANYGYDAIGNLVKDDAEGITSIEWTVYGKIAGITKVKAGLTTNISYTYDAAGNRISKTVNGKKTWYVRDASGNVMAIYENGNSEINSGHLSQVEVDLYGSSRLGLWKPNRDVQATGWDVLQLTPAPGTSNGIATGKWIRGETFFELSNHLGNVLATILDRKIGVDGGTGNIDHYTADVASASDYYPFGMQMPERKYASGAYRYGFNGKEQDNESSITTYDYGFRIYNPALGRFLSVDPLFRTYPYYTPYQFASNSPIIAIDVDGLESSNDKNPTSQEASRAPAAPSINPSEIKKYDASSWLSPLTKIIPSAGTVEHSHTNDINNIYSASGGDDQFSSNETVLTKMNSSLTPVRPGSVLLPPSGPAVTNLNNAFYSASESGSQNTWINLMLGGLIRGIVPENIVFSENGTVSNFLRGSAVLNKAVRDWYKAGQKSEPFGVAYGPSEQVNDVANNGSIFSVGNFVGSARAQITYSTKDDVLRVTITNVTSVNSGDYGKHLFWHNEESPFLLRDPGVTTPQPYTNFSQTYQLKFSYKSILKQLGNEYKLIE